ncbi:MAG: tetratricopeptide repeat protein [Crocinitomicaceae bacterium]|nr:tetratricopeptide repeat protein [Crocinitomicaceae bacterium]
MRLTYLITMLFISATLTVSAQKSNFLDFVKQGIEFHDSGDFKKALNEYRKALKISPESPMVHYEIGSTYFAMEDHKNAIKYADMVIDYNDEYVDQAYILKGNALDSQGKTKDAIKVYKQGIRKYGDNYLLHFNLALTYYNSDDVKNAESSLKDAIVANPYHSSSNLLLGYIQVDKGERIPATLCMYKFLLLEASSSRSSTAHEILMAQMKMGVTQTDDNTINISFNADSDSEFQTADLMLSMLEASRNVEENEGKTDGQLFFENTDAFFAMLGEIRDGNDGFWWKYYVDFFYEMHQEEQVETFSYFVSMCTEDEEVFEWLDANESKINDFSEWYDKY